MENFIIGKLIKQLHIALENNFNKFSKKYKLTSSQMDILIFLLHNENKIVNQRDIENFLSLSNPTIAGTLLRLEKKGFIIRKISSKDKRYKEIYLTDKSRELKDIIFKYIRDNDNKMFSNMSEEEKENLKNIITKILNNIQK
ncbi:MarR family transcriptional regulator [Brachyspira aalborgi]|jgi:DNA-binding MarR family transcriptional regulator|uniref:MarR family transcriptional regulator n=1 Tax=Brachyspira aalborgi TaxID=29522 RepID=A0A5C8FS76_9SPIR|nr:MarR family transcriptional regulator [Brachyspira aalborgi]MBS4763818.1 MarR family transcriptional regulator [Brachyspira sp.]TXJ17012.1 MarR family transcriptional regulator [Brachyspira aalborgi]TXJ22406.1 MarR family transcriptional regulator [Brachyspira aalborgi]TXJ34538.1 MarR family transcriptional regulator [Brachyspira aalborgi]TXJ46008.1 MarR family transcriptional regulator [Brachyspira aalborgi]